MSLIGRMGPWLVGGERDQYWTNVSLLVHCDGSNGSTTLPDSSPTTKTITVVSPSALQSSAAIYGVSGFKGPTSGTPGSIDGGFRTGPHADFNFGTGDVCVEGEFRSNNTAAGQYFWDFRSSAGAGNGPVLYTGSPGVIYFWAAGTERIAISHPGAGVNKHIRWSRVSGTTRIFFDGVEMGSWADSTNYSGATANICCSWLNGYAGKTDVDEIRITKGVGRSSSGFTRPATAWPDQ